MRDLTIRFQSSSAYELLSVSRRSANVNISPKRQPTTSDVRSAKPGKDAVASTTCSSLTTSLPVLTLHFLRSVHDQIICGQPCGRVGALLTNLDRGSWPELSTPRALVVRPFCPTHLPVAARFTCSSDACAPTWFAQEGQRLSSSCPSAQCSAGCASVQM